MSLILVLIRILFDFHVPRKNPLRPLKSGQMQGARSPEERGPLGYRSTLKDRNDEERGERRRWAFFSNLLSDQSLDFCQHLTLGEVLLRGCLVRTDGSAGPAALAQGVIHR